MQFQSFLQDTSTCTKALIEAQVDKCAYVTAACADEWDYLNFIGLYYCDLNENFFVGLLVCFVFILISLQFLGTTADAFLAESLEVLTKKMKISDAVAGVTFLALGKSANDVITGIVAGGKSSNGVLIATGGLLGACLFTITIVFARCIQGAGHIRIVKSSFLRDSGFMLLALIYLFIIASVGPVTLPMVCVFFVFYAIYFAVVVYQAYNVPEIKLPIDHPLPHNEENDPLMPEAGKTNDNTELTKKPPAKEKNIEETGLEEEEEDYPDNLYGRFMYRYDQVLLWVRQLTMPQFDDENYNKWMAFAPPVFGLLFCGWILGILPTSKAWVWYTFLGIAVALEILIFAFRNQNLAEKAGGVSAFITFFISILWIDLIASAFLDMLDLLAIMSGLPLNFLSLTVLAWGNSMDDFFIDYTISKRGKGPMAITSVFGGQLFNFLIGLGGSLFRNVLANGPISFNLFSGGESNDLKLFQIICTTVGVFTIIVVTSLKKFEVGKSMMWFLILFYLVFFVGSSVISIIV